MINTERDIYWMKRAIELARKGKGRTSPNPAVGAVIVKNGKVIGEGWHRKAGKPHAEVEAIRSRKVSPKGSTIYVTLEPCNHHGKTPPCVEAIIEAGIKEVVIGSKDTSPKKGMKGAAKLRRAGLSVRTGVLKDECDRLIEDFIKHSTTGLPLVLLKTAITLDGKVAASSGDSKWISSKESRRYVHAMRNEMDAVMIGVETALADDPQLTVRYGRPRLNPLRVVVDSSLRIPSDSQIVKTAFEVPTIIATTRKAKISQIMKLEKCGANVLVSSKGGAKVNLRWLLEELGRRDVMSVMLEGAGKLAGATIKEKLVDRVMFFIAPKIVGGSRSAVTGFSVAKMADALELADVEVSRSGVDVVIEGRIK